MARMNDEQKKRDEEEAVQFNFFKSHSKCIIICFVALYNFLLHSAAIHLEMYTRTNLFLLLLVFFFSSVAFLSGKSSIICEGVFYSFFLSVKISWMLDAYAALATALTGVVTTRQLASVYAQ